MCAPPPPAPAPRRSRRPQSIVAAAHFGSRASAAELGPTTCDGHAECAPFCLGDALSALHDEAGHSATDFAAAAVLVAILALTALFGAWTAHRSGWCRRDEYAMIA